MLILLLFSCDDKQQKKGTDERGAVVNFPSYLNDLSAEKQAYNALSTDTSQMDFLIKLGSKYPAHEISLLTYISTLPFDSVTLKYHLTALLRLGQHCLRKGAGDSALHFYRKGIEASLSHGSAHGFLGMFYREVGRFYASHSNYANAIEFYNKAIDVSEKHGVSDNNIMYISELGSIYQLINEHEKALANFTKAKEYGELTKNVALLTYALNALGDLSRVSGDLDNAIKYHLQAMEARKKENGQTDLWACTSLGKIYTQRNEFAKAKDCFDLVIKEAAWDKNLVSQCYLNLSRCEHKKGIVGAAIANAAKAYKVSLTSPELNIRSSISRELAVLYKENKEFEKALEFTQIHQALEDSLNNKEQIKKRAEVEYRHKEEKLVEKNELQLKAEKEKRSIEAKRNNAIILSIAVILALTLVFSFLIFRSLQRNKRQNKVIQEQKQLVEIKQKEILDSIHYAKRIQSALILNNDLIREHFSDNFVVFKPKDIVSGDFYWATKRDGKFYLAVCDSTGHGVPGAFMSLLNVTFLNEAINEKNIDAPHEVFNYVRQKLVESISQEGGKDGMDGVLVCWDTQKRRLTYAAAHNTPFLVSGQTGKELEADKMPIGKGEVLNAFRLNQIELKEGDTLYLFTDGYADQFGGPKGKKLMSKKFHELLVSLAGTSLGEQKRILEDRFNEWKGDLEQTDDVLVVGIRV